MLNYRYTIILLLFFTSCGSFYNQPFEQERARLGETTVPTQKLKKFPLPQEPIVAAVYNFKDQTGQYKAIENGSTFSTAVSQGATTMLNKALEDSNWFTVVERENLSNLLNERNIIRSTRAEFTKNNKAQTNTPNLPALLFAGVLLEGGVISYDTNIITGGAGARYLGIGGSTEYRQDRITVYLRAVSTSNGKILKTVYISKTILSQALALNLFKYVKFQKLLESEVGFTKNEPVQLAVKEAIDKAVENLIIEGIIDGFWAPAGGEEVVDFVKKNYKKEQEEAKLTELFNRKKEHRRGKIGVGLVGGVSKIVGDYSDAEFGFGADMLLKFMLNKSRFAFSIGLGSSTLSNKNIFEKRIYDSNVNFEYYLLPYDKITPYAYIGVGSISTKNLSDNYFKYQYGIGLEYFVTDKLGLILRGEQNIISTDNLDLLVRGEKNDKIWNVRAGINFYF
ncbi:CsgG/HfaB family protein [Polaribacter sp. HaHaR_3_91]|uniref:CsgG/HfaB family protein n=1 Tax=Polaribacter sp. HaHaR_3_91 TaxID=2745561 RepID=UPI001C4FFB0F|nr:CsgG/HfaB family protein [Polaribacter sp. HaHaR_3_91]QXP63009.1 outer membrane beta-barrel protein [Polaribacter sp. HaHaR_3_91]